MYASKISRLFFLASIASLAACQDSISTGDQQDPGSKAPDVEALLDLAVGDAVAPVPEPLRFEAAVDELGGDIVATVMLDDGRSLYLAGDDQAAAAYLDGRGGPDGLRGVVISHALGQSSCLGVFDRLPAALAQLDVGLARDCSRSSGDWVDIISANLEQQDASAPEAAATVDELAPKPAAGSCAVACGPDDGLSYAGEIAYSNGSDTGTEYSCNGVDTYGNRYQCVQFTERVHKRSDWSGNAYVGYWSSTTAGPWQKGLLPLASGNNIAPPLAGDVLVWPITSSSPVGHVGIVASVGSTSLTNYDQNRSCGSQSCTVGYSSTNGVYTLSAGGCSAPVGYDRRGWDFSGAFGISGWSVNDMPYVSGTISGTNSDPSDYITLNPGTVDPWLQSPAGIRVTTGSSGIGYNKLVIVMKSACANKNPRVYFKRTSDAGFDESRAVSMTLVGSDWNKLTFNMASNANWNGIIDRIRIDPASTCSSGNTDLVSFRYAYFTR